MVMMQQMSCTVQRAKEKIAEWEMHVCIPTLENGFNEKPAVNVGLLRRLSRRRWGLASIPALYFFHPIKKARFLL